MIAAALLVAAPGLSQGPAAGAGGAPAGTVDGAPLADERASYSFLRTLEGDATVAAAGEGIGNPLELNQPLLTGDLLRVGPRSRLELALSDRHRVHLDAGTSVVLERLAFSGDREERVTVLRLEGGELLLEVSEDALGDELPRIITANSTVYIQQPGQYRIEAGVDDDGQAWTRVVTRRGYAEIVTDRGSSVVREEESMTALGDRWTRLELAAADAPDALERWSAALADRALAASRSARYVEPHLAYDAAPLDQAGDWVEYQSVRYWRPYVSAGWRPYWQGRWDWTPSGYTWVSYEPWGWVPYHYGRWCSLPGYGWVWRPGAVYSPAWVYWNWTSGWAGWVPMGYYSQFYNPWYGDRYRYGVYGWAGGGWGIYSEWNFAPVHCFRDRHFRGNLRTGRDLEHETRLPEPPRGLLTTDTRDFRPDRIDRTEDLLHEIGKRNRVDVGQELPDVTDFGCRKGRLPSAIERVVVPRAPVYADDSKGRGADRDAGHGVIRDIASGPKIAETPGWKNRDAPKTGGLDRTPATHGPTFGGTQQGPKGTGSTRGDDQGKGAATPRSLPPAGSPAYGEKGGGSKPTSSAPENRVYGTKGTAASGDNRQLWKEKGGESEPVQKVVGSVRRPTSGGESQAPSYGDPKSGGSASPAQPYGQTPSGGYSTPGYGKGTSSPQGSAGYGKGSSGPQSSPSYGKGSSGSQGSPSYGKGSSGPQSSPSYGKGSSGPQTSPGYGKGSSGPQSSPSYGKGSSGSQGSPSYGKGSSGSQRGQGAQSYGKSPSGSQSSGRSQPSGKGAASSGSGKSSQSAPPPPPPDKKDGDGGHHH